MAIVKAIKDKNETILKIGDRVKDAKDKVWKLENVRGVSRLIYPVIGRTEKSLTVSKVDFTEYEKVS